MRLLDYIHFPIILGYMLSKKNSLRAYCCLGFMMIFGLILYWITTSYSFPINTTPNDDIVGFIIDNMMTWWLSFLWKGLWYVGIILFFSSLAAFFSVLIGNLMKYAHYRMVIKKRQTLRNMRK